MIRVNVTACGSLSFSAARRSNDDEGPLIHPSDASCAGHGNLTNSDREEVHGMTFGTGGVSTFIDSLGNTWA